jgi:spermidine synthase
MPTALLLVILFFLSGFLALVYEVVWIRKLGLVFGSTSIALSTVLGIFFGGIALGSFLFGRMAGRCRNPVRVYAWLELGVGAFALLFPTLLGLVDRFYGGLYAGAETRFLLLTFYRVLLVMPLIMIPTTLMGGTLPVLSRHFVSSHAHLSTRIGVLYAINTLGGALGAYLCGFYLIYWLGVDATNYAAGAVNLLVGAAAWLLSLRMGSTETVDTPPVSEPSGGASEEASAGRWLVILVLVGFGISGLTGLAYEVVWARYLSLFLVSSIYAYTTILTVFLLGLVAGAVLFARWFERRRGLLQIFAYVQIGIGLTSLVLLPALVRSQALVTRNADDLFVREFLLCAVLMIVPTTLMGATLPLVSKIATREIRRVGRTVGTLYAVNTVGAIAGSILAGFLFLPWLGIGGSNRLLVALNLALGLLILLIGPGVKRVRGLAVAAGAIALAWIVHAGLDAGVPAARLQQLAGPGQRIVDLEEGLVNTVWVSRDSLGRRSLWTDSSIMGRTGRSYRRDLSPQRVQGHIPMLLHPGDPARVLGIAFGTGQTFGAQLLYPIERLDVVDISRAVVDVSLRHFGDVQSGLANDPRVRIVVDDGRAFVDRTSESYDVVSLEMPPHEEAGIVHFYTLDFYRSLRERLRPGGVIGQWVPIYNVTPAETASVVRTFLEVFPEAVLWYNAADILLVGYEDELRIDFERLRAKLADVRVADDLDVSYLGEDGTTLNRPRYFLAGLLAGPRQLAELARGGRIYTDDRPDLEFTWTEFEVWGPERRDLLVLENTDLIERHLSDGTTDPGTPWQSALPDTRRDYIDQMRAGAYDNLGNLVSTRDPGRALDYYGRALRLRPGFAQAHNNLGTLYLDMGQPERAIPAYREAIRLDPDYAQAHFNLGAALEEIGTVAEALAAYAEANRVSRGYAPAHLAAARLHARAGSMDDAEAELRAAIEADPGEPQGYLALAQILGQAGRTGEAIETIDRALGRFPEDRRVHALRRRLMD